MSSVRCACCPADGLPCLSFPLHILPPIPLSSLLPPVPSQSRCVYDSGILSVLEHMVVEGPCRTLTNSHLTRCAYQAGRSAFALAVTKNKSYSFDTIRFRFFIPTFVLGCPQRSTVFEDRKRAVFCWNGFNPSCIRHETENALHCCDANSVS